jgi:hypothetical protein
MFVRVLVIVLTASDLWVGGPSVETPRSFQFHVLFLAGGEVSRFGRSELRTIGKMDLDSHAG